MTSSDVPFSNAARNLKQLKNSPVSWAWAGVIVGIQALITVVGGKDQQPAWSWFETFGLSREGFLAGKVWQVFSYGFLHGGWLHAGLNALFVLLIGSRIEYMAGRPAMMKCVIGGIVGGGVGHLLVSRSGPDAPLLVGFSGACISLLLLLTTLSPQSRMMPLPVSARSLGAGILIAELFLALIDPELKVPGLSSIGAILEARGMGAWFEMGHACHFGGGIFGWMMGRWLLRPRVTLKRLRRDRERREASRFKGAD